jgi:hypothetical protein
MLAMGRFDNSQLTGWRRKEVTAMTVTADEVKAGMAVVGSDGYHVGAVKEVRTSDFLVDMKFARDHYVPLTAVQEIVGDQIKLNLEAAAAYRQNWPTH